MPHNLIFFDLLLKFLQANYSEVLFRQVISFVSSTISSFISPLLVFTAEGA